MNPRTADPVRPLVALLVLILVVAVSAVARPHRAADPVPAPAPSVTSTATATATATATNASASDVLRPGTTQCPASSGRRLPCSSPLWFSDHNGLTSGTQHREVRTRAWTSHWMGDRIVGGEDLDRDGVVDVHNV